jgi:hypothetical protein
MRERIEHKGGSDRCSELAGFGATGSALLRILRQHRQIFDLVPWDGEHVIASPCRLFGFIHVNDHEGFIKLHLEAIALQLGNAVPLLLPDVPLNVSRGKRPWHWPYQERVANGRNEDEDPEND